MTDRPKFSEIVKAVEEGREVSCTYAGKTRTIECIPELVCFDQEPGLTYDTHSKRVTSIHIEPPTSYTLGEACAAMERGERVEAFMPTGRETNGWVLLQSLTLLGDDSCPIRLGFDPDNDLIAERAISIGSWRDNPVQLRPAPPEPSIEDLMRAHDPVSNPTVIVSFSDEHYPPEYGDLVISRMRAAKCGHWCSMRIFTHDDICLDDWDDAGNHQLFTCSIKPATEADKARYAEWAEGQKS